LTEERVGYRIPQSLLERLVLHVAVVLSEVEVRRFHHKPETKASRQNNYFDYPPRSILEIASHTKSTIKTTATRLQATGTTITEICVCFFTATKVSLQAFRKVTVPTFVDGNCHRCDHFTGFVLNDDDHCVLY
jgi:hypothetical protein